MEKGIQLLIRCHLHQPKVEIFHHRLGIYIYFLYFLYDKYTHVKTDWILCLFLYLYLRFIALQKFSKRFYFMLQAIYFQPSYLFVFIYSFLMILLHRYRVVLFGDAGTGKTALVSQFMTSEYMHTYDASLGKLYEFPIFFISFWIISLKFGVMTSISAFIQTVFDDKQSYLKKKEDIL